MTRILVAALLLLSSVPLRAQRAATGTFEGYVVSERDQTPIKDVKVTFKNIKGGAVYKTKTSAEGHFQRDGLTPGDYELTIYAKGYETVSIKQRLQNLTVNQVTPLPIMLKPRN